MTRSERPPQRPSVVDATAAPVGDEVGVAGKRGEQSSDHVGVGLEMCIALVVGLQDRRVELLDIDRSNGEVQQLDPGVGHAQAEGMRGELYLIAVAEVGECQLEVAVPRARREASRVDTARCQEVADVRGDVAVEGAPKRQDGLFQPEEAVLALFDLLAVGHADQALAMSVAGDATIQELPGVEASRPGHRDACDHERPEDRTEAGFVYARKQTGVRSLLRGVECRSFRRYRRRSGRCHRGFPGAHRFPLYPLAVRGR